jgi:signal peptidase I
VASERDELQEPGLARERVSAARSSATDRGAPAPHAAPAGTAPLPKPKERARRSMPWRENIEALVVAIAMAVFLKYFVVEAYKIPTGSMQPTLMGQPFPDGGGVFDRILVDKLSYHLRAPQRFEVVVFKYPLDRSKNFVKRLWGLPGEGLRISGGDVWVRASASEPWHIPRRPPSVQRECWRPLDLGDDDPQLGWEIAAGGWRASERALEAHGPGRARFAGQGAGPITDGYLDGYPQSVRERLQQRAERGANRVGDVRVEGEIRALAGSEAFAIELTEGERRYRFELPGPAAKPDARPQIAIVQGKATAEGAEPIARGEPWRLPADRWVSFAAQNLDDELQLEFEGGPTLRLPILPAGDSSATAEIIQAGAGVDLRELQVLRDIYYTSSRSGDSEWQIPEGSYFMLGDNTQDSSDSREWTLVDVHWTDGGGQVQSVVGNMRPPQAPDANPLTYRSGDGATTWVRDEWGETYHFPPQAETTTTNGRKLIAQPFVQRELITGRAVLVFWPIAPKLGLWRLRWVR